MRRRPVPAWLRRHARSLTAALAVLAAYGAARLPTASHAERRALAARFAFHETELPNAGPVPARTVRTVHPDFERIRGWISAVGAAVALHDLDGDGLPNDACWVDTRADRVVVAPVPGTGERYAPFALVAGPVPDGSTAPMGCLPGDFDEEGTADLLVYFWGRGPLLFLRSGAGAPSAAAYRAVEVAPGERWHTNAATRADVDGDGHADLVVGNYFPDGAGVLDASGRRPVRMQQSMSRSWNGGRNRVLLRAGARPGASVSFREARGALPDRVALGWTLALAAADLDGDLLPEIYVANDFGSDRLLHNRSTPGRVRFAVLEGRRAAGTPRSRVLGRDSYKGMGADFGDLNGDGRLDLFVSNIAAEYALEESHFAFVATAPASRMKAGVAPFTDRGEALGLSRSGWGWDARIADLDNDGTPEVLQAAGFMLGATNRWPELQELAMGNDEMLRHPRSWPRFAEGDDLSGGDHNPFFVRGPGGRYVDLAPELGLDRRHVGRGIATADVDGDGRLDYAAAHQWERAFFYRNRAPRPGSFLGLSLVMRPAGAGGPTEVRAGHPAARLRPAVGAAARVALPDGGVRVGEVDGGSGHSGKRSPQLHWGLGDHPPGVPVRVEVAWRDGAGRPRRERFTLRPGWHTVILGDGGAR